MSQVVLLLLMCCIGGADEIQVTKEDIKNNIDKGQNTQATPATSASATKVSSQCVAHDLKLTCSSADASPCIGKHS